MFNEVIQAAPAFQDAYYQRNEERFRYETKEDLSKEVARVELREAGYDEEFVGRVEDCIEATKHHADPAEDTTEEITVRATDLRGLMGTYKEFQQNSEALREEQKLPNSSIHDYKDWVEGVLNTLHHYASQNLELTPEHETSDGLSEFHAQLGQNIGQFIYDYVEKDMQIEVDVRKSGKTS
ncbi:MAG: hypothetical protein J07AB43_11630 [Candidatus Nanosalina sp. J07AB43]|jgi:hypothetical protein|nr:MAG: hypothetical protein J07AB43_11630 [Candidatus Nanosalina sp. J07AB43]